MKVFFGLSESGVAYWRGKLPANKIKKLGLCDTEIFSIYNSTPEESDRMVLESDVVYCPSACGIDTVVKFLQYYQMGKAVIADYDDNLFDCHPFNPGYSTLGLKEVKIRIPGHEETWLWKDGRTGFSIKDNQMRFNSHIDVLNVSTLVTTTTDTLKDKLYNNITVKDDNGDIISGRPLDEFVTIPNAIDFDLFKNLPFKKRHSRKLRIGWTASDSHVLEGQIICHILKELNSRRNDFEFVIMGNVEKLRSATVGYPIEWHPFVDISIYPLKLASLELDIGIAPLDDFSFNHCKSELKWSEYSALKIPTVCSNITPYQVIRHGVDGMLANDPIQFVDHICTLMDDSLLRRKIANQAYERNYQDYNLDKVVYKWVDTFKRALDILPERQLTYKGKVIPRDKEVEVIQT